MTAVRNRMQCVDMGNFLKEETDKRVGFCETLITRQRKDIRKKIVENGVPSVCWKYSRAFLFNISPTHGRVMNTKKRGPGLKGFRANGWW